MTTRDTYNRLRLRKLRQIAWPPECLAVFIADLGPTNFVHLISGKGLRNYLKLKRQVLAGSLCERRALSACLERKLLYHVIIMS